MIKKMTMTATLLVSAFLLTNAAQACAYVTNDDSGDLNPQPLPPIVEEM